MRLLERKGPGEFRLTENLIDNIPPHAILSHTWGPANEEVTLRDLMDDTGKSKPGYDKIRFCGEQAERDGLKYFWVDTCCIDKADFTELSEAINSMFRWYRNAAICYVFLSDVSTTDLYTHGKLNQLPWESAFRSSRWFTRGWTLQELIAPESVVFFSSDGMRLGDKESLEQHIYEISGVAIEALRGTPLSHFGVDERMSWRAQRKTERQEDEAYSLLGIFDIHMPLIYGEGKEEALVRLQEQINKLSMSKSIMPISSPCDTGLSVLVDPDGADIE
jgi:hypothetical protein